MARTRATKRKASMTSLPIAATAKKARHARSDNASFPFLELPRELRDEVYRHFIEPDMVFTLENRNLVTKCGLVGVNDQICEEFLDAVLLHAPVINTNVRNHNFAHVVTFLNRLSDTQYAKFQAHKEALEQTASSQTPKQQEYSMFFQRGWFQNTFAPSRETIEPEPMMPKNGKRKIRIMLSYSPTKRSTTAQLNRWLDRFNDPRRRGADVEIEYVLDHDSYHNGGYKQRPRRRANAGTRSNEEAKKIIEVLSAKGRRWW